MKSTGHEKSRVSVCLTAKGNDTKLQPFVVFSGAKRDVTALNTEFHGRCVIASSESGCMNTSLTNEWVKKTLGSFSFRQRLRAWDTYQCHLEKSVTSYLMNKEDRCGSSTRRLHTLHSSTGRFLE